VKKKRLALVLAATLLSGAVLAQDAPKTAAVAPGDQDALRDRAFSAAHLTERRRALVRALGDDVLVVLASGTPTETDARTHRATRDFLYLTGVEDPSCFLLLTEGNATFFAPPRNKGQEIWTGVHTYPGEETAKRFGFDAARSTKGWKEALAQAVAAKPRKIFLSGIEAKELPDVGSIATFPAAAAIGRLRQVKDEDELALMKRACEISATAMLYAARAIAPERFEFEAQGLFEGLCRFYGAETQGYPSIVGSGPNSCVLHYDKNRRRMKAGDLVVLDAGSECGGYSSDVTRTYPVSGKYTKEQRRVYEAVYRAQEAGIKACRPGATVHEVGEASRAVLEKEGLLEFLPHGVSHWLGLDVHDAGDYAKKLEPGNVLTVEPGCYMAEKELGVRIEDDILVTDDGPVNLSGDAPRTADDMEALMARARTAGLEMPALPAARPVPPLRAHRGKLY
jgi:Xaa-Pro aminopeptidase